MNVLEQAQELVALASPSQQSNRQVSQCVQARLQSLGFEIERVQYVDAAGVSKVSLVGRKGPPVASDGERGLAYFSHSDVVPAESWSGPSEGPFLPTVHECGQFEH